MIFGDYFFNSVTRCIQSEWCGSASSTFFSIIYQSGNLLVHLESGSVSEHKSKES